MCSHIWQDELNLPFFLLQIVKIFSEDGMGKVVEIPADMTARDLCQLLVYKSHCVDDNSWALVEHHPLLGIGKRRKRCSHQHTWTGTHTHIRSHLPAQKLAGFWVGWDVQYIHWLTQVHSHVCMHACVPTYLGRQTRHIFSRRHILKHECMCTGDSVCTHVMSNDLIEPTKRLFLQQRAELL